METSEMKKQFAGYLVSKLWHDQINTPAKKKNTRIFYAVKILSSWFPTPLQNYTSDSQYYISLHAFQWQVQTRSPSLQNLGVIFLIQTQQSHRLRMK